MDVSSFMGGNYLTHVDLSQPVQQWTIGKVDQQLVGQGPKPDQRVCITFNEFPQKPLALNKTNLRRVAGLYSVQGGKWAGKQLQVYRSVTTFGSEIRLCVRVCGPQQAPPDPVCDPQGAPVAYQPPAPPPQSAAPAAPPAMQQVAAPPPPQQPVQAPQQQPVQPPAQQPVAAPSPQPQQDSPWGQ